MPPWRCLAFFSFHPLGSELVEVEVEEVVVVVVVVVLPNVSSKTI